MPKSGAASRDAILSAAASVLQAKGAATTTVEAVSRKAGCAKGLVHYHFKTKDSLVAAAVKQMAAVRIRRWSSALKADSPNRAIRQTWALLLDEASDGTVRAWTSLTSSNSKVVVRSVKDGHDELAHSLSDDVLDLLRSLGLEPTIPATEIGWLAAAVIYGMGQQLTVGEETTELEGAYAASWLGILSLTRPAH